MKHPADIGADIARVTAIVAEANEKRAAVEHELKSAHAAVESLKTQSTSLEQSLLDMQQQLEAALKRKAAEEAQLIEISNRKTKALNELSETLTLIEALRKEYSSKAALIDANLEKSRAQLGALESGINETKKSAAATGAMAAELRQRLASVRESGDRLEAQLSSISDMTSAAVEAAHGASSRTAEAIKAIELADQRKLQAVAASEELNSMARTLQQKRDEMQTNVAQIDQLIDDQNQPSEALTTQLSALAEIIGAVLKPKSGSPPPDAAASAPPPANAGNGSPADAALAAAAAQARGRTAQDAAAAPVSAPRDRRTPERSGKHFTTYLPVIRMVQLLAAERALGLEEAARLCDMLREGRPEDALRAARTRAQSSAHRLIAACIFQTGGDVRRSYEAYVEAAVARDATLMTRYLATLGLQDLGKLDEALKVGHTISNDKQGAVLWRNLVGLHQRLLGRPEEAQRMFNEALQQSGFPQWQYNEALYNMGELLESQAEREQALRYYERLYASNPMYRDVSARIEALKNRPAAAG
jgi:tetratricopeptide (TPR) repeat protein